MAAKLKQEVIQNSVIDEELPEEFEQFITFLLGEEEYGIGVLEAKEIMNKGQITNVPNMPDFIKGIINLRGKIVIVIDLAKRFSLNTEKITDSKHIIIAVTKDNIFGLLVDEVTEVLGLPKEKIKPVPKLFTGKIASKYLSSVATLDDRIIVLLDTNKVLSEIELVKLINMKENQRLNIISKEEKKVETKADENKSKDNAESKKKTD